MYEEREKKERYIYMIFMYTRTRILIVPNTISVRKYFLSYHNTHMRTYIDKNQHTLTCERVYRTRTLIAKHDLCAKTFFVIISHTHVH